MTQLKWGRPREDKNRWEAHLGELKVIALIHPSNVVLSDAQAAREPVSYDMITYLNGGDRRTLPVAPLRSAKLRAEGHVEKLLKAAGLVVETASEPSLADKLTAGARQFLTDLKDRPWPSTKGEWDKESAALAFQLLKVVHTRLVFVRDEHRDEGPDDAMLNEVLDGTDELGIAARYLSD